MNEHKLEGHVLKIIDQQGKSKPWTILVISYPAREWQQKLGTEQLTVPVKCFAKQHNQAQELQIGQKVIVMFRVEGREYNGKWYGDILADSVSGIGKGDDPATTAPRPPQPVQERLPGADDDVPF